LKKALLFLFALQVFTYTAKAQLGYNFHQYSLGFGAGSMFATTDVPYHVQHPSFNLNFGYNLTPFTSFTFDFQFGKLSGGYDNYYKDAVKNLNAFNATDAAVISLLPTAYALSVDPYLRSYTNNYQTYMIHGDVQFGEFLDYENGNWIVQAMKNFYVGTGIGIIYNNISSIRRYNADTTYVYGGADHSNNIVIPMRVGYKVKLYNAYDEPSVELELGYQRNMVFGYGLDGYSDPIFTTRNYEVFEGIQVGVKFNFGNVTSYRKQIH